MVTLMECGDDASTSASTGGAQSEAAKLVAEGDSLFVDDDLDGALERYSKAALLAPTDAVPLSKRAAVHLKMESFTDAVADANRAIELDPKLAVAYLRKGTACFELEEYATALHAFRAGSALEPNNKNFSKWIRKCHVELEAEGEMVPEEAPATARTAPAAAHAAPQQEEAAQQNPQQQPQQPAAAPASTSAPPPAPTPAPAPLPPKYRHEWYQTPTQVVVTIFAKGIASDQLHVDFGEQVLVVRIAPDSTDPYTLMLRLFGKVKPDACKHVLLSTKVEVRLAKADAIHWTALEASAAAAAKKVVQPVNVSDATAQQLKHVYPSSSKHHIDWNKVEQEVKAEEKDEKLEGDAALNKLFQDIYKNADEDTRRAMNKSFVESGGTVLSTNWKDVGKRKVTPKGDKDDDSDRTDAD